MAKKVAKVVKLQVPGGKATPAPPVGSLLRLRCMKIVPLRSLPRPRLQQCC